LARIFDFESSDVLVFERGDCELEIEAARSSGSPTALREHELRTLTNPDQLLSRAT
jgi:hypothetical protein